MINSIAPSVKVGSAQIRPNAMTRNPGLVKKSLQVTIRYRHFAVFHVLKAPNKVLRGRLSAVSF